MQSLQKRYASSSYPAELFTQLAAVLELGFSQMEALPSEDAPILKRLARIGLKSESFAREALSLARVHPELLPRALDLERMAANLQSRDQLRELLVQLEQLTARVRAAVVLHGVDAYADGLTVYHSLQRHGDDTVREATGKLGRIFRRGGKQKEGDGEVKEAERRDGKGVKDEASGEIGADGQKGRDAVKERRVEGRSTKRGSGPPEDH